MVADMLKLWYLTRRMQGMTGFVPLRRVQQINEGIHSVPVAYTGKPTLPPGPQVAGKDRN